MTSRSFIDMVTSPLLTRKLLWLLVLATLVIVSLIIVPLIPTKFPSVDSKVMALQIILWIVMLGAALNYAVLRSLPWRLTDTAFAAVLLSFCLSTIFSGRIGYSLSTTWHQGGLMALAWMIYRFRPSLSECRSLVWIIGALGIIASLYGFLTYIGKDILRPLYPFTYDVNQGGRNFIHSFFGNPEYFAGFAAPTAIILLGLAFQPNTSLLSRGLWLLATGFVLMIITLSGSRSAFLGFLVGAVVQFLGQVSHMKKTLQRLAWVAAIVAVVVGAIGVTILSTPNALNRRDMRLLQRFTDISDTRSESVRERIVFYTTTAVAIPSNPLFGYGPGAYRLEFLHNIKRLVEKDETGVTTVMLNDLNRRLAEHTHNDYLEIWFDQGTLGFAAFLFLLVHAAIRFVTTSWSLARRKWSDLAPGAALHASLYAAFLTMCLNAMTSFPFQMPARSTLAWILVGSFFAIDSVLYEALQSDSGSRDGSLESTKAEEV